MPPIVAFQGGVGTGKTFTAWAIARELVRARPLSVRVVTMGDLVTDLWDGRSHDRSRGEAGRVEAYRSVRLLIVDDVSRGALRGDPRGDLYAVLAFREQWRRPTILTTSEHPGELARLLGEALTSRLLGSSGLWRFGDYDRRAARNPA